MARQKKEDKVQWNGMPVSNSGMMKDIKIAIESTYNIYQSIENAKADLKDIFDDINGRTGIPKRVFNFLAKSNFKGDGYETIKNNEELENAYNAIEGVQID